MNPFSAFLQPRNNQAIDMSPVNDALSQMRGRAQDRQHVLENSQQNALAQGEQQRANSYLQLQQAQQAHKFSDEDQKQVEGLLAEYHDALDTNDPIRVARATEMLKRFGMDVQQGTAPDKVPDLKAFTGQQLLPTVPQAKPDAATLGALTGQPPNPIDQAVQTELKSREALKARNGAPAEEPELSQDEFEQRLINNPLPEPSRYEEGGKTTEEFKKMLPQSPDDQPVDMGDVDSPEFKAAAAAEGTNGNVIDLDKENPAPLQIGSTQQPATQPQQPPPRLPTQLLPTIISRGGKVLEQSQGPSGRYSPMVAGVFEPFTKHENPEVAAAGQRAQALASKLVNVDGISPKQAIEFAGKQMQDEISGINQLERTKIGSRAHVAGAVAGGQKPFSMKDRSPYANLIHQTITEFKNENIEAGVRGYDAGLSAINSSNPASQYDAINQLLAARSGKTVSDRERAIYDNLAGVWAGLTKKIDMASGQQMPSEYRSQIRQLLSEAKNAVVQAREERAKAAEDTHRAKLRGADPDTVESDARAVGNAIRMGSSVDENADLDR